MKSYICPPKLQTRFLLAFWTVFALLVFAILLTIGAMTSATPVLVCAAAELVFTARPTMQGTVFDYIMIRVNFWAGSKSFRRM